MLKKKIVKKESKWYSCCGTHSYGAAGLFIGMGIGLATGFVAAGMFIGLGVGMLLSSLMSQHSKDKSC